MYKEKKLREHVSVIQNSKREDLSYNMKTKKRFREFSYSEDKAEYGSIVPDFWSFIFLDSGITFVV